MVLWVTAQFIQYHGFLMAKTELVVLQGQAVHQVVQEHQVQVVHQELVVVQEFQEHQVQVVLRELAVAQEQMVITVMMVQIVEDGCLAQVVYLLENLRLVVVLVFQQ
jgi:hypothetical protein